MTNDYSKHSENLVFEIEKKIKFDKPEYREAFLETYRHEFITNLYDDNCVQISSAENLSEKAEAVEQIYSDKSLIFYKDAEGNASTISTPSVVAAMINLAKLSKNDKVLEIGSGSGYSTEIFSKIVGEKGFIVATEINNEIYEQLKLNISKHNIQNVYTENTDGGYGVKDFSQYDKIIVSCTTADITKYWINQLKMGGTLVAPFCTRGIEVLVSLTKTDEHTLKGSPYRFVHFYALKGEFSILSHYFFTSKDLKTLKTILEEDSQIDEELSADISRFSDSDIKNFFFFLSLKNQNSICYYPDENKSHGMGYGLFLKSGKVSGIAMVVKKRVHIWGNPDAASMLKSEFMQFQKRGMMDVADYKLTVFSDREDTVQDDKTFVVSRKNSLTLFSF